GFGALKPTGWWLVGLGIVMAPVLGFLLGVFNTVVVAWLARKQTPHRVDKLFRRLQLLSAALYSLGHGGNDAQKTMGIIVMLLGAAGPQFEKYTHDAPDSPWRILDAPDHVWRFFHIHPPVHNIAWWIILTCCAAI